MEKAFSPTPLDSRRRLEELIAQRIVWSAQAHSSDLSTRGVSPLRSSLPLGLSRIDAHLPERGLACGAIHEWFLDINLPSLKKHHWLPPLSIILGIICRSQNSRHPLSTAWIGRRCWPAPHAIAALQHQTNSWEQHHIFLDPQSKTHRLWSIIELLRSRAISVVIADGSTFDMKATRRMQLAAKQSKTIGCIVRPLWELTSPSVAHTRWKVSPLISANHEPQWILELIRSKGGAIPRQWTIEWVGHEENPLCVLPELGVRDSELSQTELLIKRTISGS